MPDNVLLSVLAALIAATPGLVALWLQKTKGVAETKKLEANAVGSLTGTALSLVKELSDLRSQLNASEARIDELRDKLDRMMRVIRELLTGVARLSEQIRQTGEQPVFVVPVYEGFNDVNND